MNIETQNNDLDSTNNWDDVFIAIPRLVLVPALRNIGDYIPIQWQPLPNDGSPVPIDLTDDEYNNLSLRKKRFITVTKKEPDMIDQMNVRVNRCSKRPKL